MLKFLNYFLFDLFRLISEVRGADEASELDCYVDIVVEDFFFDNSAGYGYGAELCSCYFYS